MPLDETRLPLSSASRGGKREGAGRPVGPEKVRYTAMILPRTQELLDRIAFVLGQPHGVVLDQLIQGLIKDQKFLKNLFDISPSSMRISITAKAERPSENKNERFKND